MLNFTLTPIQNYCHGLRTKSGIFYYPEEMMKRARIRDHIIPMGGIRPFSMVINTIPGRPIK
jgi:hypothetical protein